MIRRVSLKTAVLMVFSVVIWFRPVGAVTTFDEAQSAFNEHLTECSSKTGFDSLSPDDGGEGVSDEERAWRTCVYSSG